MHTTTAGDTLRHEHTARAGHTLIEDLVVSREHISARCGEEVAAALLQSRTLFWERPANMIHELGCVDERTRGSVQHASLLEAVGHTPTSLGAAPRLHECLGVAAPLGLTTVLALARECEALESQVLTLQDSLQGLGGQSRLHLLDLLDVLDPEHSEIVDVETPPSLAWLRREVEGVLRTRLQGRSAREVARVLAGEHSAPELVEMGGSAGRGRALLTASTARSVVAIPGTVGALTKWWDVPSAHTQRLALLCLSTAEACEMAEIAWERDREVWVHAPVPALAGETSWVETGAALALILGLHEDCDVCDREDDEACARLQAALETAAAAHHS